MTLRTREERWFPHRPRARGSVHRASTSRFAGRPGRWTPRGGVDTLIGFRDEGRREGEVGSRRAARACGRKSLGATIEREDTVRLGTMDVPYVFKRVPRRRHVHLLVNDQGVMEVRAPWRFSRSRARDAMRENAEWVLRALEGMRERLARRPRLTTGLRLPLLDESLRLEVRPRAQMDLFHDTRPRPGRVVRRGEVLSARPASLREADLRALLEAWYRREATTRLAARIEHFAPRLGVRPSRVTVRGQRSRWGSCSGKGSVSLNWRLMLVPGALADYVVVHELCHLRHMDHSPRFWAMVESVLPDYRQRRRRLDALQGSLPL